MKTTIISNKQGRLLYAARATHGRVYDQTMLRMLGFADLLEQYPNVTVLSDTGYRGTAKEYLTQVTVPPPRLSKTHTFEQYEEWERKRKEQSSNRICVEYTIGSTQILANVTMLDGKKRTSTGHYTSRSGTRFRLSYQQNPTIK